MEGDSGCAAGALSTTGGVTTSGADSSSGVSTGAGGADFGVEGTFSTGGFPVIEGITGGIGARNGAVSVADAAVAAATDGGAAALAAPPPAMKALTFATSSSVRLAKAEPFPPTPALVQMSTRTLLSSLSSLASE